MVADADILNELYMLTGKVHKDKNYLFYLLMKDGCMFQQSEESESLPVHQDSVSSLEEWFNQL